MLGIGFNEIVVIGVVLLLFVGPDGLPRMMRDFGRMYAKLRRAADDLRRAFVIEADRQDAEERFQRLQERRKAAREAREKAKLSAGEGAVEQSPPLPGLAPEHDDEGGDDDRDAEPPRAEPPPPGAS